jgi:hypothetical protein
MWTWSAPGEVSVSSCLPNYIRPKWIFMIISGVRHSEGFITIYAGCQRCSVRLVFSGALSIWLGARRQSHEPCRRGIGEGLPPRLWPLLQRDVCVRFDHVFIYSFRSTTSVPLCLCVYTFGSWRTHVYTLGSWRSHIASLIFEVSVDKIIVVVWNYS